MRAIVLHAHAAHTPQEIYAMVEREGPRPGDSLKVVQRPATKQANEGIFRLVLVAILWYLGKQQREQKAGELLDDLFKGYNSSEELEKELQAEFNVSIFRETLPDMPDEWPHLGMGAFEQAAYGEDEPDISHIAVREPNPEYRPWKKDA
jgi:hypothetical protein